MKNLRDFTRTFGNIKETEEAVQVGRQHYYMNQDLLKIHGSIDAIPASLGIFIGEMKNKRFNPSLALLDLAAMASERKAFINEVGARSFLFGKDVHKTNVTKLNSKSGLVLVQDSQDRNLGLGEVMPTGDIKMVLDKGDFLRREMD